MYALDITFDSIRFIKKLSTNKPSSITKRVYFKGSHIPANLIAMNDAPALISERLQSWCKTHNFNYSDIDKVIWT